MIYESFTHSIIIDSKKLHQPLKYASESVSVSFITFYHIGDKNLLRETELSESILNRSILPIFTLPMWVCSISVTLKDQFYVIILLWWNNDNWKTISDATEIFLHSVL